MVVLFTLLFSHGAGIGHIFIAGVMKCDQDHQLLIWTARYIAASQAINLFSSASFTLSSFWVQSGTCKKCGFALRTNMAKLLIFIKTVILELDKYCSPKNAPKYQYGRKKLCCANCLQQKASFFTTLRYRVSLLQLQFSALGVPLFWKSLNTIFWKVSGGTYDDRLPSIWVLDILHDYTILRLPPPITLHPF